MSHPPQNLRNHTRYIPLFHFVAAPILVANLIYAVVLVVRAGIFDNWMNLLVALALVILFSSARRFATTVQDRIIRLEEQLRFERLLPADLLPRIHEFTLDQYAALRFASDPELPALAREVLDQRIHDRTAIKEMVKEWRPDHLRT